MTEPATAAGRALLARLTDIGESYIESAADTRDDEFTARALRGLASTVRLATDLIAEALPAIEAAARALGAAEERERLRERAEPRWHLGHGNDFATCIWPRCIEIRWLLADPEDPPHE